MGSRDAAHRMHRRRPNVSLRDLHYGLRIILRSTRSYEECRFRTHVYGTYVRPPLLVQTAQDPLSTVQLRSVLQLYQSYPATERAERLKLFNHRL